MNFKLDRYAPAGLPFLQEIKIFLWTLGISVIYSFGFLIRYMDARENLYEFTFTGKKVLISTARMPYFDVLLGNAFAGFYLLGILAVAGAIYHYIFHSLGSKSIYLMKRLPNRWELSKRCFTLPAAGIVISLFSVLILYFLYLAVYHLFTPPQCLPTAGLTFLRSVLL